jgi:hypothetical protein
VVAHPFVVNVWVSSPVRCPFDEDTVTVSGLGRMAKFVDAD